jgi:hypothetical protein
MNNPTKTAKGDEMTSQASSSSLPIVQPSIQLMPQLSKRSFVADKAEIVPFYSPMRLQFHHCAARRLVPVSTRGLL